MSTETIATDLIPLRSIVKERVFTDHGGDAILDAIKAEVERRAADFDISTSNGRAAIRSTAAQIASMKVKIDDLGKDLADELNARLKPINGERKRLREALDTLRDQVRQPLTEFEDKEKERIKKHQAAVTWFSTCIQGCNVVSVEALNARLAECKEVFYNRDWDEFADNASSAYEHAVTMLIHAIDARTKADAQAAELERLRAEQLFREQKERDERIAADAKAQAQREVLRLEAERLAAIGRAQEAELKAIAEREAHAQAQERREKQFEIERQRAIEAERSRFQAEMKERERLAQIEAARLEDENRKREQDKQHRNEIHWEILKSFVDAGMTEDTAKQAATAIITGRVKNVTIQY